ncbi:small integral membrane protein 9 [Pelodiscus sinensis]|uniref:small integral membrane protein 9 n=1 Tax=Pelodiscus sinensis TaxID=13735 RepID=UPI003F6A9C1C
MAALEASVEAAKIRPACPRGWRSAAVWTCPPALGRPGRIPPGGDESKSRREGQVAPALPEEAMAPLRHTAVFPVLLCLTAAASCKQATAKPQLIPWPRRQLFRSRAQGAQEPGPGSLLALQEEGKVRPFAAGERGEPGQESQRVRRSWLADYTDDLWIHVRESFPRVALYAFPLALGFMLLLCCITVLLD